CRATSPPTAPPNGRAPPSIKTAIQPTRLAPRMAGLKSS
ncbi:MAG: hypothetical protein AVDCRST_MAG80-198, partial [uncultured Rubrobacteraceae bacterium]